jgi:hypothetical protein
VQSFDDRGKPGGYNLLLDRFLSIFHLHLSVLILPIIAIVNLFAIDDFPDLLL